MEVSVWSSIFFVVTYLFFFMKLFGMRKSNNSYNGVAWLCITFVLTLWINTMIGGVMSVTRIPLSLFSMGICYIILGVSICMLSKEKQTYTWRIVDAIAIIVFMVVAGYLGIVQHGTNMQIAYLTSDPSIHFRCAMEVMESGDVVGKMFYAPLNNGLFINLLSPWLKPIQYYKAFVLADIIMFAVSGCVFYSVIVGDLNKKRYRFTGIVMSLFYMIAYPLNNKIFGFVYLGMAVTIILVIIYILKLIMEDNIQSRQATLLLMLGCHAIVMCYMLFAPFVYFAILFTLIVYYKKKIFSKTFFVRCLKIFLLPCVLAVWFCYIQYFGAQELKISDAIAQNGGIYGNVYTNFLSVLPFVLYAILMFFNKKRNKELLVFAVVFFVSVFGMLMLAFQGTLSLYYFYKLHFPFWAILCWIAVYGIMYLWEQSKQMLYSYITIVVMLFVFWCGGVNATIVNYENPRGYGYRDEQQYNIMFEICSYNFTNIHANLKYSNKKMKLYSYVMKNCMEDESVVPMFVDVDSYKDCYWYESITRMLTNDYYVWSTSKEEVAQKIFVDKEVNYAVILYENPLYEEYKEQISQYKKVYKNAEGCVLQIK